MVTMTEFTNCTYFTAEFVMMNMKVPSPKVGKVRSRNGHVFVEIATTRNIAKHSCCQIPLVRQTIVETKGNHERQCRRNDTTGYYNKQITWNRGWRWREEWRTSYPDRFPRRSRLPLSIELSDLQLLITPFMHWLHR